MKTAELTGPALDWAVSLITNPEWDPIDRLFNTFDYIDLGDADDEAYTPSTDWAQGGLLIESNDLNVTRRTHSEVTESGQDIYRKDGWTACTTSTAYWITPTRTYGPTALVAAMRCLVASKLGYEIELPKELT